MRILDGDQVDFGSLLFPARLEAVDISWSQRRIDLVNLIGLSNDFGKLFLCRLHYRSNLDIGKLGLRVKLVQRIGAATHQANAL